MNFNIHLSVLLALLLCGCSGKKSPTSHVTLKLVDHSLGLNQEDFSVINQFGDALDFHISKTNNEFSIEIDSVDDGYYGLVYGEEMMDLYLAANNDFSIALDSHEVKFSGAGAEPNQYLRRKYSPEFDWYSNYYRTKQKGDKILYFRDHHIEKLKQELDKLENSTEFVKTELKELEYRYSEQLLTDRLMLETNPETDKSLLADLGKVLTINVDNFNELNNSPGYVSVVAKILVAHNRVHDSVLTRYYNGIHHPNFKTHFLENLVGALSKELQFAEDDFGKSQRIEAFISKQQPGDSIGHHIFNVSRKFKEAEGQQADFNYEDVNGETVSLEEFRGKYVYVDFWASWCVNCIKEFPYLKKLDERFENDPIEFVGISIDKPEAKEKWKKVVSEKDLENAQLISPYQGYPEKDSISDDFVRLLYVNSYYLGIPQYALIDPDGKVVDAFFYRPSNPKAEQYLAALVN